MPSRCPLYIADVIEPRPIRSRSFAQACVEGALMWDYERNCGFGPEDFSYGSSAQAWFKCPNGPDHRFQKTIENVTRAFRNGSWAMSCGHCRGLKPSVTNNIADLYPEVAKEWMTRKNGKRADQVSKGSSQKAWWKCKKGHVWQTTIVESSYRKDAQGTRNH